MRLFSRFPWCWESPLMYRSSTLHMLENINKWSLYIRQGWKTIGYRLSYTIMCAYFISVRELTNVSSFFSLHTLIKSNVCYVHNKKKKHYLQALLSGCLLIFCWRWKKSDLCISDHCSKGNKKMCAPPIFISFLAFVYIRK